MKKLLDEINFPKDLRKIPAEKLPQVAQEVRDFLIESVAKTGGHFGSNLGVVELTVALHWVFDTPKDLLIWDVGHQSYPHKILTGRKSKLNTIRKYGGLAPFTKREESEYDVANVGHASTSVGLATGLALANKDKKNPPQVVAVIGDGSLGGGMAFEALNHAGDIKADILVILNDNRMSISPNVGGMREYLTRLISSPSYVNLRGKGREFFEKMPTVKRIMMRAESHAKGMITPGTLFEELGFEYYGPIDGHDLKTLVEVLQNLKKIKGPKFLHVITKKGKGYQPAEKDRYSFHAVSPFDPATAKFNEIKRITYTDIFSDWIMEAGQKYSELHVITPAMCSGSGLGEFSRKFPGRYHDVGIAEQHAVTLAAGMALAGKKPVVAIYSTFLQRAFDQLIHDVALQNLNILFAVDRAGIVGPDGATHAGSFDLTFLRAIPNLIVMAPSNENECYAMLETGFNFAGPAVVRYPKENGIGAYNQEKYEPIEIGKAKIIREGENIAILAFGVMAERAKKAADKLGATFIDMRFVKPLDKELLKKLAKSHKYFVTVEDNVIAGGAGSAVNEFFVNSGIKVNLKNLGLPDKFLEHGAREKILAEAGLDEEGILNSIQDFIS